MNATAQIQWIETDLIEEPLHLLRSADTESPKFKGTLESMRVDGFWPHRPLDVSEEKTGDGNPVYILNDGMQRLTCARILKLPRVPVVVLDKPLTEGERLERSIVAQATAVDMKPVEFAKGLAKLVELNEGITNVDLAKRCRKEPAWVAKHLKLAKLEGPVAELVDLGQIPLANAVGLVEIQKAGLLVTKDVIEKARTENVNAFAQTASAAIEAHRSTKPKKREPVAKLRLIADVKAELDRAAGDPNAHPAYVEALRWTLRKDPVSAAAEGIEPAPPAPKPEPERFIPLEDVRQVIQWALGAGGDEKELSGNVSDPTWALIGECRGLILRAIEIITPAVIGKKTGSKDAARWLKGERSPSYAHRRVILETFAEPIYRNLREKSSES